MERVSMPPFRLAGFFLLGPPPKPPGGEASEQREVDFDGTYRKQVSR
jgi:hypothetical protein